MKTDLIDIFALLSFFFVTLAVENIAFFNYIVFLQITL